MQNGTGDVLGFRLIGIAVLHLTDHLHIRSILLHIIQKAVTAFRGCSVGLAVRNHSILAFAIQQCNQILSSDLADFPIAGFHRGGDGISIRFKRGVEGEQRNAGTLRALHGRRKGGFIKWSDGHGIR